MKLTWHQGENKPEPWKNGDIPQWDSGCLFIGSKGMLLSSYDKHLLLPEKDFAGYVRPAHSIKDSIGHHNEWVAACKSGELTTCHFDYSGPLSEVALLGNVAYRTGKKLEWDSAAMKAMNCPEADRFIQHHYRRGWTLQA